MKFAWLSGWGVSPDYVRRLVSKRFPDVTHEFVYPGRNWEKHLPIDADFYLGHSLGAFLLLRHLEVIPSNAVLVLLAPFGDFRQESGRGGRVNATQLKFLLRMLRSNPVNALNDFYQRAGLPHHCESHLPYGLEDLIWGIEQLLEQSASESAFRRTRQCLIGLEDKLLDVDGVAKECASLNKIPNAGHALKELLPHLKLHV